MSGNQKRAEDYFDKNSELHAADSSKQFDSEFLKERQ